MTSRPLTGYARPQATRRPTLRRRVVRRMDIVITRTQEWLESPDGVVEKVGAIAVVMATLGYLGVHLFFFIKGGE